MPNSNACRAAAVCATMAIALLCGCRGGDGTARTRAAAAPTDSGASPDTAVRGLNKVVFQMTGALLILPSHRDGDRSYVLLPKSAHDHVAWLGIGLPDDPATVASLCDDSSYGKEAQTAKICYVDLSYWKLLPFGATGQPTRYPAVPNELLNVSDISGNVHSVHFLDVRPKKKLRSMIVFTAGRLSTPCSLASWQVDSVKANGDVAGPIRRPLANVVNWEIEDPAAELVFQHEDSTITVPLAAPGTGAVVRILLAAVPDTQVHYLPPRSDAGPSISSTVKARHFHSYYDLLTDASLNGINGSSKRRSIPEKPMNGPDASCKIAISSLIGARITGERNIGTYACMPATGDGP